MESLTTPGEPTDAQNQYIKDLREGSLNVLSIKDTLTNNSLNDFTNFKKFLLGIGHPNPQPADLYLTVLKEDFLNLLRYANDRQCLILQCCFGFDNGANQIRLIQKGNFVEAYNRTVWDFFYRDTIYKNGDGDFEMFHSMSFSQAIFPDVAQAYIDNFRALYPPGPEPFIYGYLLPVKALTNIFNNPGSPFARANQLTFRWGLTTYVNPGDLGNFTLVIGTHDLFTDPTIEFRKADRTGQVAGISNDCPPNRGC